MRREIELWTRKGTVRDGQGRKEQYVLILAIAANVCLCILLFFLTTLITDQSSEPVVTPMDDVSAMEEPTATEIMLPSATPSATKSLPVWSATPPLLTIVPTATPEPTRREILVPTRPPYVFPTPIFIPTAPRERFTPTRIR